MPVDTASAPVPIEPGAYLVLLGPLAMAWLSPMASRPRLLRSVPEIVANNLKLTLLQVPRSSFDQPLLKLAPGVGFLRYVAETISYGYCSRRDNEFSERA